MSEIKQEVVKLYKEYDELMTKLKPLRKEYTFVVDDIEEKKKKSDALDKSNKGKLADIESKGLKLEKERSDFDFWKEKQETKINVAMQAKQTQIKSLLIKLDKREKELAKTQDLIDKQTREINSYKTKEYKKLEKERLSLDNDLIENTRKTQVLIERENILEAKQEASAIMVSKAKEMLRIATEKEEKANKLFEDAKNDMRGLLELRNYVNEKEDSIIEEGKKTSKLLKDLEKKEKKIAKDNKKLEEEKHRLENIKYNLDIKEADLLKEERRLILILKQTQNG